MRSNNCYHSRTTGLARVFLGLVLITGCSHDDVRLRGSWRSNRDATVAATLEQDPRWKQATPERLQKFGDLFGHMTITYLNGVATADFHGTRESARYRVVERGADYVIIHSDFPIEEERDIKLRFVDGNKSYWIHSPFGIDERFDKVLTR